MLIFCAECTHDTKIDGNIRGMIWVTSIDKNIAWVHVSMKKVISEDLGEKNLYASVGEIF